MLDARPRRQYTVGCTESAAPLQAKEKKNTDNRRYWQRGRECNRKRKVETDQRQDNSD